MATTLLLDRDNHDLCLDSSGNIALATEPYAQVQDAGCYIRTFLGDCWYNTSLGIPYDPTILGAVPNPAFISGKLQQAALQVPGVTSAKVALNALSGRNLTGTVTIGAITIAI